MSKKKNKFKKKLNKRHERMFSDAPRKSDVTPRTNESDDVAQINSEKEKVDVEVSKKEEELIPAEDIAEYAHVKVDVKKILLIMTIIVVLLLVTYYIDLKTSYLNNIGNWIYKILNIQTQ